MWQSLVNFIISSINFFYDLTVSIGLANYGLAIILFTIVFKMILYPLTVKQMRSMRAMQVLGPKIKELQEKHKKDPQKAQQAMMELYKKYNVNPIAGCLPILVQMPILFALFTALREFPYRVAEHASFLWIPSLSQPDPIILPILAAGSTFIQMKTTTNTADQTQKIMLYAMPLVFGWVSATFPSGLALYWVAFSIVGAVQQYFINKKPLAIDLKEDSNKNDKNEKSRKNSKNS